MTDAPKQTETEIALEARAAVADRLFSPSVARNLNPIRKTFLKHLPEKGVVLEIGAGTGEHAVALAGDLPDVRWCAGDPDETSRRSISAWAAHAGRGNIATPHAIDVATPQWTHDAAPFDAMVSINMIHIAPFAATQGLLDGAGRLLRTNAPLLLYGPFSRGGVHTSPSNAAFHESLQSRNPAWGVRDIEQDIAPICDNNSLAICGIVEMPANNFSIIIRKR